MTLEIEKFLLEGLQNCTKLRLQNCIKPTKLQNLYIKKTGVQSSSIPWNFLRSWKKIFIRSSHIYNLPSRLQHRTPAPSPFALRYIAKLATIFFSCMLTTIVYRGWHWFIFWISGQRLKNFFIYMQINSLQEAFYFNDPNSLINFTVDSLILLYKWLSVLEYEKAINTYVRKGDWFTWVSYDKGSFSKRFLIWTLLMMGVYTIKAKLVCRSFNRWRHFGLAY